MLLSKLKKAAWFLPLVLLLLVSGLTAADSVPDRNSALIQHISWFLDTSNTLDIAQIRATDESAFRTAKEAPIPQGFQSDTLWLRFEIPAELLPRQQLILLQAYALNDEIALYPPSAGSRATQVTGDKRPFPERSLLHRYPALPVTPESGVYHLRVRSSGSLQMPLELLTPSQYVDAVSRADLTVGIYHGMMLLLVLGSFVAFVMMAERIFLLYAVYLLAHQQLQFALNGLSFEYFWPELTSWANLAPSTLAAAGIVFAALFVMEFLDTANRTPILHRVFQALIAISLLSVPIGLFIQYQTAAAIVTIEGIVLAMTALSAGLVALRQGYHPARFLLVGWSAFLCGMVITAFVYHGLLPPEPGLINAMQIGSTLEVLILILALADRVRMARIAQEQTLKAHEQALMSLNEDLEHQVSERTRELLESNQKLEQMATLDGMTGLLNHRFVLQETEAALADAQRYHYPVSLLMIDLDHFKLINDRLGHPTGDKVLIDVAKALRSSCRQSDLVGRYGGDEFLMVLSHASTTEVMPFADRLRLRINRIPVGNDHGTLLAISIGIAVFDPDGNDDVSALLEAADAALYQAKLEGRNRIKLADAQLSLVGSG